MSVFDKFIIAGGAKKENGSVCSNDSGGGLVLKKKNKYVQIGKYCFSLSVQS